ncbi:hypothetical protein H8356DRAFT_1329704 [Neocallimastix lanati (nom. inval.)]|nr:hypothetical protein H8356DRAFT_1329704 [Neocallimastix sp. JGI-2020a]
MILIFNEDYENARYLLENHVDIMNFLIFIKFFIDRQVKVRYERNDQIELISAPLIFSINLNHTGFVRTLLDHQISLNERDENGNDLWKLIQIENINIEIDYKEFKWKTGRRISTIINAITGSAISGWIIQDSRYISLPVGKSTLPKDPMAWFTTLSIYFAISFIILVFCFTQSKEHVVMEESQTYSVKNNLYKQKTSAQEAIR